MNYEETERRYLTVQQVEKLLPKLERIITRLQALNSILDVLDTIEIEVEDEDSPYVRHITKFNKTFHRLSYEFYEQLDRLEQMGAILRDVDEGIVDFWYNCGERDVFLCWQLGEKKVEHWHEEASDFQERKKIIDLQQHLSHKIKKS